MVSPEGTYAARGLNTEWNISLGFVPCGNVFLVETQLDFLSDIGLPCKTARLELLYLYLLVAVGWV